MDQLVQFLLGESRGVVRDAARAIIEDMLNRVSGTGKGESALLRYVNAAHAGCKMSVFFRPNVENDERSDVFAIFSGLIEGAGALSIRIADSHGRCLETASKEEAKEYIGFRLVTEATVEVTAVAMGRIDRINMYNSGKYTIAFHHEANTDVLQFCKANYPFENRRLKWLMLRQNAKTQLVLDPTYMTMYGYSSHPRAINRLEEIPAWPWGTYPHPFPRFESAAEGERMNDRCLNWVSRNDCVFVDGLGLVVSKHAVCENRVYSYTCSGVGRGQRDELALDIALMQDHAGRTEGVVGTEHAVQCCGGHLVREQRVRTGARFREHVCGTPVPVTERAQSISDRVLDAMSFIESYQLRVAGDQTMSQSISQIGYW
jgi:hypothetical protein